MISTKLLLYKHKTLSSGKHPVVIQVLQNRKRSIVTLKFEAHDHEWNFKSQRFKSSKKIVLNYEELNQQLERYELKARRVVDDLILSGEPVTRERIKRQLFQEVQDFAFLDYVDELIEDMKMANEIGNSLVYRNVRNSVEKFFPGRIQFSDLNVRSLKKYKVRLKKKGLADSTIHLYLRTVRAIFNKAIQDGEISMELYPFKNQMNPNGFSFSDLRTEPNHRALTLSELDRLLKFDVENNPELKQSYYLFIFMFLCRGINWADLCKLKRANLKGERIQYKRAKTGKMYSILLNEKAKEIIEEFSGGMYLFPLLNERHITIMQQKNRIKKCARKINSELKLIAMKLDIDPTNFTTYCARHTYAMTLRRRGISDEIISQALGHSDLSTTKHYLESFEDSVVDEADRVLLI